MSHESPSVTRTPDAGAAGGPGTDISHSEPSKFLAALVVRAAPSQPGPGPQPALIGPGRTVRLRVTVTCDTVTGPGTVAEHTVTNAVRPRRLTAITVTDDYRRRGPGLQASLAGAARALYLKSRADSESL